MQKIQNLVSLAGVGKMAEQPVQLGEIFAFVEEHQLI